MCATNFYMDASGACTPSKSLYDNFTSTIAYFFKVEYFIVEKTVFDFRLKEAEFCQSLIRTQNYEVKIARSNENFEDRIV